MLHCIVRLFEPLVRFLWLPLPVDPGHQLPCPARPEVCFDIRPCTALRVEVAA